MPTHLTEDELKEAKAVRSQVAEILDEGEDEEETKARSKKGNTDEDKIREEGEREGKKAALKSILAAMSDEDERQKLHDKVDASDDEDLKKDMDEMHSRKGRKASTPDIEDHLKNTKHMTDAATIAKSAALQARLKLFEDKEKKVMVDDLVALKASIVPNVDEDKYHQLLMERSFDEIDGYYQGRADEIEAMKARQIINTSANRGQLHPTFAFNARTETSNRNSNLSSLDAVFEGGSS